MATTNSTTTEVKPKSIEFLWREARVIFLAELSTRKQQKEALHDTTATLDNTIAYLKTAQERASKAFGDKFKGTRIEFNLGRALKRLDLILSLGDNAMKFAPETASYVWAAFRMVLSGVTENLETCEFIATSMDQMTDTVFICQVYARRQMKHLPVSTTESQMLADKVLEKIPAVLALVLKFAYETRRLLMDKGKIRRIMSIMLGSSQELKDIVSDARSRCDDLHRIVDSAFREAAQDVLEAIHIDTHAILDMLQESNEQLFRAVRDVAAKTEDIAPAIKAVQNEQERERELEELKRDWEQQISWLRSGRPAEMQQLEEMLRDNLQSRHAGTCKWIFGHDDFTSWLEPTPATEAVGRSAPKRLLHVVGEAGFGKSVLMSSIIEWLRTREVPELPDGTVRQQAVVLMFFCKTGNDTLQTGNRIMLSLLLQLFEWADVKDVAGSSSKADDKAKEKEWMDCKRACIDLVMGARNESKDGNTITFQEFQVKSGMAPLISSLARRLSGGSSVETGVRRPVYIVLDALDECADRGNGFLEALVLLAETAGVQVRIIVSSRRNGDIHAAFKDYDPPQIEVTQTTTAKDVKAYIKASLAKVRRFTAQERKAAMATIAKKADGMFRYANLAIESLSKTAALNIPAEQVIKDLPTGLSGLYSQQLQALDDQTRQLLLVALRWVMCGEGKIDSTLVADELENTYFLADERESKRKVEEVEDDIVDSMSEEDGDDGSDSDEEDVDPQNSSPDHYGPEDDERDAILRLKAADRNFLNFDEENNMALQHKSVRDYIEYQKSLPGDEEKLCRRCLERYGVNSALEAGSKHGHLEMALYCVRMLNSEAFRGKFLVKPDSDDEWVTLSGARQSVDHQADEEETMEEEIEEANGSEDTSRTEVVPDTHGHPPVTPIVDHSDDGEAEVKTTDPEHTLITRGGRTGRTGGGSEMLYFLRTLVHRPPSEGGDSESGRSVSKATNATLERPTANVAGQTTESDAQKRYEMTHWHYHVREAERHWAAHERNSDKWKMLYEQIDKLFADDGVLQTWQRLVVPQHASQSLDTLEPHVHIAARFGIMRFLRRAVEEMSGDVNLRNENDSTLLHLACLGTGGFLGIELLVEHGADINARESEIVGGGTPLHNLVRCNGPPHLVRYLMAHGADPTLPTIDKDGTTVLHMAVLARNLEIVEALLEYEPPREEGKERVDVNAPDNTGETALHRLFAWPAAPEKLLRLLLDRGADVNAQDRDSQAPLYEATLTGNLAATRVLLEKGADVDDLENIFGRTALHEAVDTKNADIVQVLLEAGADPLVQDKGLRNAISIAVYRKDATILKLVLDTVITRVQRASFSLSAVEAAAAGLASPDMRGDTPLHIAASHGHSTIVNMLLKASIDLGNAGTAALATATNRHGNTPLHSAAGRGYVDTVAILLQHGADVHARNVQGASALDLAIRFWRTRGVMDSHGGGSSGDGCQNNSSTINLLFKSKAALSDLDLCRDLFDVAIESASVDICVKILEEHQDSHNIASREDRHAWTPLMVACQTRQADIAALLKPYDAQGLLEKLDFQTSYVAGMPPTRWNVDLDDKIARLSVSEDGLEVSRVDTYGLTRRLVRADHPIPFNLPLFYFEITVIETAFAKCHLSIGIASRYTTVDIHPGWSTGRGPSFGYHADDGGIFMYIDDDDTSKETRLGGPTYNAADTVGCGLDSVKGTIFFTHNGILLGDAPHRLQGGRFFPAVGMGDESICVRANFGVDPQLPFEYDPDTYGMETSPPNGLSKENYQTNQNSSCVIM